MQVRKQLLEAFAQGQVKTRDAYIALEHEWMHLETLAYMLAQEQRMSFELSSTAANGQSHGMNGNGRLDEPLDDSSDDEITSNVHLSHKQQSIQANTAAAGDTKGRTDGQTNGNMNGDNNGYTNGHTSGPINGKTYDRMNGLGPANGHSSHTNGHSHVQLSNGHAILPVSMIEIPAGEIALGTDTDPSKNFVWDNEGPKQSPQHVSSFRMASSPVSNAEFYKFAVDSKGYEDEEYWRPEDLACLKKRKQSCPTTWTVQVLPCLSVCAALGYFCCMPKPLWHCIVCCATGGHCKGYILNP